MESSSLDIFKLCWDVLFKESSKFNNAFFNAEHCSLLDSRDHNFDLIENRLAYIYKYGCFNVLLLEKCISKFLNEYPAVETILHLENLNVCSLSNGPGLDIVGLLCALHKSNQRLKCFPMLKAINFHETWSHLYKLTVELAYQRLHLKCSEYFDLPSNNISFIQGDIFTKLSTEAKNYISDSNILLMVKVFVSSKAAPNVFANSLREIFSLVKPGALIFFIGSKTNTKRFSNSKSLKRYVKCIFGPQKVTIDNLLFNSIIEKSTSEYANITDLIGTKPLDSGYSDFMVWQKKDVVDKKEITKSKKRNRRKKKTLQDLDNEEDSFGDTINEECGEDTDLESESEMSFTSESKYSDASLDDLGSDSNSRVLFSPDVPKHKISEKEQDLPHNSFGHSSEGNAFSLEKEALNSLQSKTDSKSNPTNTISEIENETKISVDKYIIKSLKNVNPSDEPKNSEMPTVNHQLQDAPRKLNTQDIKFETSITTDINSLLLSNINQLNKPLNDERSEILQNEKSSAKADIIEQKENSQDIKFERSILTSKIDSKISSNVNSSEVIKNSEISKISPNVQSPLKNGNILEYSVNCTNASTDSVNKALEVNLVNPFTQNLKVSDNTCSKKSKNKIKNISPELKTDNGNIKKEPKPIPPKVSSASQSCENLCSKNVVSSTENIYSDNNSDIQALLQKCERLVTSLEKLTAEIKSDISSSKDTNFLKMCCNTGQACGKCRVYHSHINCVNSAHRCCCRQEHGCQISQNSCRSCSFPCESNISRLDIGRPTNLSRPYITIPLENEELLHILTSRKK